MKRKILGIDDDPFMLAFLGKYFTREGYEFLSYQNSAEALRFFEDQAAKTGESPVDCVISDINMPSLSGMDVMEKIKSMHPDLPVILITAFASVEAAVRAIKTGAYDYVTKPFQLSELKQTVEKALQFKELMSAQRERPVSLSSEAMQSEFGIIGTSQTMKNLFHMIRRVAPISASVLISGESGTGKELVARAIHMSGSRKEKPFVAINCAAIPETLLESELFGHVKGSFTGALNNKRGLFAEASQGTIFLDEIGDMSLYLQAKLLRVLQERKIRPVGSNIDEEVDVRVISATHRDLKSMIREGTFREDLFYRLSVIPIAIPALRDRRDDIPMLAEFFLKRLCDVGASRVSRFTSEAFEALKRYPWKGNVRQLENFVERAAVLADEPQITERVVHMILDENPLGLRSESVSSTANVPENEPLESVPSLRDLEKRHLLYVLEKVNWKKEKAAEILGISRKTLYRKEIEYGIRSRGEPDASSADRYQH